MKYSTNLKIVLDVNVVTYCSPVLCCLNWSHLSDFIIMYKVIQCVMCCVQGLSESPDFEFEYADTDKWAAELSGLCGHHGHRFFLFP